MRRRSTAALLGAAMTIACLTALAMPAVAAKPGMTVKIPATPGRRQRLRAGRDPPEELHAAGDRLGAWAIASRTFRKSKVTIHLTNQAFLRLSSSAKRSVKKAMRRGQDREGEGHGHRAQLVGRAQQRDTERHAQGLGPGPRRARWPKTTERSGQPSEEFHYHLELTPAQLKITHTALKSLLDDFGHEEHEVQRDHPRGAGQAPGRALDPRDLARRRTARRG